MEILESSEFNPRAYHSDSLQSTIYDAPAQSTTVSLKCFYKGIRSSTLNVIYLVIHVLCNLLTCNLLTCSFFFSLFSCFRTLRRTNPLSQKFAESMLPLQWAKGKLK